MATRDLYSNVSIGKSIVPTVWTATATGSGVDLKGAESAILLVDVGAVAASGNVTVKLQESSDNSTFTDVASADLVGTIADPLVASTPTFLGYIGAERYVRAVGTLNSGTSVAFGATIVRSNLHRK